MKFIVLFIALIFFDQFSKYFIRHYDFINGGFYICNSGISFGLKIQQNFLWIVYIFTFTALIYLIWQNYKQKKFSHVIVLMLILSGAIGNLIDRIALSCVVDFIRLPFWPVFNLADSFIVIGAAYYLGANVLEKK